MLMGEMVRCLERPQVGWRLVSHRQLAKRRWNEKDYWGALLRQPIICNVNMLYIKDKAIDWVISRMTYHSYRASK